MIQETVVRLLPPTSGIDVLWPQDAINRISLKQMRYLWGRTKDAIASSDVTKAPIVA